MGYATVLILLSQCVERSLRSESMLLTFESSSSNEAIPSGQYSIITFITSSHSRGFTE